MAGSPDAIVVGAGPNGLSAAVALAQAGLHVVVYEARDRPGGGASSAEVTLPGFTHDLCSAVHPTGVASPYWRTLPLAAHGLKWIAPPVEVAHPLDDGPAGIVWRSLDDTARDLGDDGGAYRDLFGPVVEAWPKVLPAVLGAPGMPAHPFAVARFGLRGLPSAAARAGRAFVGERARAIAAGMAGHAMLPLESFPTGAVTLVFTAFAHTTGWPFPEGGAQRITAALASLLASLGGEIVTGTPIADVDELPPARAVLFDLSPRPLLRIAGHRFTPRFRRQLERFRYGPGAFKIDWALDGPIPWRDPRVGGAGTVHVGGTLAEIAASERDTANGRHAEHPYVLLAQPTLFDPSRAPAGRHVAWGYCHVPNGSTVDMLPRIEAQIERFAPGFRDRILARHVTTPAGLEERNPNLAGGDIGMGAMDWPQIFRRPTWRFHGTSARGLYICSASTPPGAGVHGMCGYLAAQAALREVYS